MFKFKGHKTAKLHPVLQLQISSMVWAEVRANSIPILSIMLLEEVGYLPQPKNISKKLKNVNTVYIIRNQTCFENEGICHFWHFLCLQDCHFTQVNIIMK